MPDRDRASVPEHRPVAHEESSSGRYYCHLTFSPFSYSIVGSGDGFVMLVDMSQRALDDLCKVLQKDLFLVRRPRSLGVNEMAVTLRD